MTRSYSPCDGTPTAKISINLSTSAYERLGKFVKSEGSNASVVCEASLVVFDDMPALERSKMLRRMLAERRPQTPTS